MFFAGFLNEIGSQKTTGIFYKRLELPGCPEDVWSFLIFPIAPPEIRQLRMKKRSSLIRSPSEVNGFPTPFDLASVRRMAAMMFSTFIGL